MIGPDNWWAGPGGGVNRPHLREEQRVAGAGVQAEDLTQ